MCPANLGTVATALVLLLQDRTDALLPHLAHLTRKNPDEVSSFTPVQVVVDQQTATPDQARTAPRTATAIRLAATQDTPAASPTLLGLSESIPYRVSSLGPSSLAALRVWWFSTAKHADEGSQVLAVSDLQHVFVGGGGQVRSEGACRAC